MQTNLARTLSAEGSSSPPDLARGSRVSSSSNCNWALSAAADTKWFVAGSSGWDALLTSRMEAASWGLRHNQPDVAHACDDVTHQRVACIMETELCINGISGLTGNWLVEPMSFGDAARIARGLKADRSAVSWLRSVWRKLSEPHLGLPLDIDPRDVGEAGWAIIFHCDEAAEVKEALVPLIKYRRSMAADQSRVKVLEYRSGETRRTWLARHGVAAGSVLPAKVPYYLLFVGNPEAIPFAFRHQVGVEYVTGSLHFDTAAEYSAYASGVLSSEAQPHPSGEALFFGVRHPFDAATQLSADRLVRPLTDGLAERYGFRTRGLLAEQATKAGLLESLVSAGAAPPAFIFTATHGVGFPAGHPYQRSTQGALLCQDWPGFGLMNPEVLSGSRRHPVLRQARRSDHLSLRLLQRGHAVARPLPAHRFDSATARGECVFRRTASAPARLGSPGVHRPRRACVGLFDCHG